MPVYAYRAVHSSGRLAKGHMNASNENELAHYLHEANMELIEAREKKEKDSTFLTISPTGQIPPRLLAAFCSRMHALLDSGIIFAEALHDVVLATDHKLLRDALTQIERSIGNGGGIAASFGLYPRLFSPIFVAILGAGEKGGDMSEIFGFLARYTDNRAHIQEKLRRALRYPVFLFFVAGSAAAFMLSTVVPQIVQFLNGIQGNLPLSTRLLVHGSELFTRYGLQMAIGSTLLIGGLAAIRFFSERVAVIMDSLLLRLPLIGTIIVKTSLARFAHSFSMLFRSGCDVPACLHQAKGTIGNHALRIGIEQAEMRVQSGAALSQALQEVMPPFAIGLLRTGERSANLGKSLDDIAIAYDREAQTATDNFIGLLEPCLTLTIGGLLAWTVVAVLGPLYGSLSVLGGRM